MQGLPGRGQTHHVMSLVSNFSVKREEAAGPYLFEPRPMRINFVVHLHVEKKRYEVEIHVMLCIRAA